MNVENTLIWLDKGELNESDLVIRNFPAPVTATHISALFALLPKNKRIIEIDFYGNHLDDAACAALASALPGSNLYSLRLGNNQIGDAGCASLASALPSSTLTELRLGNNQIGDAGCVALASGLPKSPLTKLFLKENQIGDVGFVSLASALPKSSLKELDVEKNQIGDAGCVSLASALPNTSLTSVNLCFNQIGEAGLTSLLKSIPSCPSLKGLNSYGNPGDDKCGLAIGQALDDLLKKKDSTCDVFISTRFAESYQESETLKVALEKEGMRTFLCAVKEGDSISSVIAQNIVAAKLVIVMGSTTYGQKTTSSYSTHEELQFIMDEKKPFFLIKMCDKFEEPLARFYLNNNKAYYPWLTNPGVTQDLIQRIRDKLKDC